MGSDDRADDGQPQARSPATSGAVAHLYTVVGLIDEVKRVPGVLNGIVIPDGTARHEFALAAPGAVHVDTGVGAARPIGRQAPLALSPGSPDLLSVSAPAEPRGARSGVEGDVNALFLVLGGVSLLVGAVGIANVTFGVGAGTGGRDRPPPRLGAARRHIAAQFLAERRCSG